MHGRHSRTVAMISVVTGLFAVMTTEIWLWAGLYRLLDIFADFETALYFSTITFSTVGYGDVVPRSYMARLGGTGGRERISAHWLVNRLPDRGGNAKRPIQGRRAFLIEVQTTAECRGPPTAGDRSEEPSAMSRKADSDGSTNDGADAGGQRHCQRAPECDANSCP